MEDGGADAAAEQKYIVCNADEGDSGTFADRMMMEGDPFVLIEGMTIAGIAVGATKGYIYIRSEYPHAIAAMNDAIAAARSGGRLGTSVAGSAHAFDLEVRVGAGAYVCGEETALLDSLEGKRGLVRAKPPLPAHKGLFGKPTVINNVLSLATVPIILAEGRRVLSATSAWGARAAPCRSSLPATSNMAACSRPPSASRSANWSTTSAAARRPAGRCARCRSAARSVPISRARCSTRRSTTRPSPARDGLIGHGGIVVFDDTVDMAKQARFAHGVLRDRILRQVHALPDRLDPRRRGDRPHHRATTSAPRISTLLEDLCNTMKFGSLCALGGFTPYPVMSALTHFPEDFGAPPRLQAAE